VFEKILSVAIMALVYALIVSERVHRTTAVLLGVVLVFGFRLLTIEGAVQFERTAIGEHLLLGGDNVDLALARRVEEKLGTPRLTLAQRNALRRQCCAAKEALLGEPAIERIPVTLEGGTSRVRAGRRASRSWRWR